MRRRIQLTGTNRPRAWRLARARYGTLRDDPRGRARRLRIAPGEERTISGGHGGGETPVPIPNTAVKPASADGTWGVAPWESRTPPGFLLQCPRSGGIGVSATRWSTPAGSGRCGRSGMRPGSGRPAVPRLSPDGRPGRPSGCQSRRRRRSTATAWRGADGCKGLDQDESGYRGRAPGSARAVESSRARIPRSDPGSADRSRTPSRRWPVVICILLYAGLGVLEFGPTTGLGPGRMAGPGTADQISQICPDLSRPTPT